MRKHDPSTQNTASSSSSFLDNLLEINKCSSFQELLTLPYGDAPIGTSNIVSSIEFDKNDELFALGSYTKRIKVRLLLV